MHSWSQDNKVAPDKIIFLDADGRYSLIIFSDGLILLKRGQRVFGINSPEQPCGVTESQGDKYVDVESGAGSAEGGDQGEDGGGGQEEAEADQGQEDGHLVYPGVEHHVSEVDTVCIICPASKIKRKRRPSPHQEQKRWLRWLVEGLQISLLI